MSDAISEAVMKAIANQWKENKAPIGENHFRGKVVIDVDVVVKRGPDIWAKATSQIPLKKVIAFMLRRSGNQREAMKRLIIEAVTSAVKDETLVGDELEVTEEAIKEAEETLFSKLPKVQKAGPTTVQGVIRIDKLTAKKS